MARRRKGEDPGGDVFGRGTLGARMNDFSPALFDRNGDVYYPGNSYKANRRIRAMQHFTWDRTEMLQRTVDAWGEHDDAPGMKPRQGSPGWYDKHGWPPGTPPDSIPDPTVRPKRGHHNRRYGDWPREDG